MNFRSRACSSYLTLALLSVASCGGDDTNATGNFSTGMIATSTDSETTTTNGDGDGDPGDGDGDGVSGDGDGDPGDGDGVGDPGDGDGDPGDGDGDPGDGDGDPTLCPAEPGDDECTLCVKGACCTESMSCEADADCVCMQDCIDGGGNNNQCKNMCDIQGNNQNYQALSGCVDDSCQVCG
jgi:hypothetical protein